MKVPIATKEDVDSQEWLVILPDNKGALETRLEQHPPHYEAAKRDAESGFFKLAGKLHEGPMEEGEPHRIAGSFLVVLAKTKEEVVQRMKDDLFYKHNVWNWDKMQIYPCKSTFFAGRS